MKTLLPYFTAVALLATAGIAFTSSARAAVTVEFSETAVTGYEGDETITLALLAPSPGLEIGTNRTATVTIRNSSFAVRKGDEQSPEEEWWQRGYLTFREGSVTPIELYRSKGFLDPAEVEVELFASGDFQHLNTRLGIPAIPGRDFTPTTNRVHFAAGETVKSIPLLPGGGTMSASSPTFQRSAGRANFLPRCLVLGPVRQARRFPSGQAPTAAAHRRAAGKVALHTPRLFAPTQNLKPENLTAHPMKTAFLKLTAVFFAPSTPQHSFSPIHPGNRTRY